MSLPRLRAPVPKEMAYIYEYSSILVPLTFWVVGGYCLDSSNTFCFFPGAMYRKRVLQCNLNSDAASPEESCKEDLKTIRDWSLNQEKVVDSQTSHFWVRELGAEQQIAFQRCAHSPIIDRMFRTVFNKRHYELDVVDGMNEVYISGPSRMGDKHNSDQVFYTKHVDGPYGLLPFVSVYRCIVGMDENRATITRFPVACVDCAAMEGDVLAFDFNREVHYIEKDPTQEGKSDKYRVVLKLHYCVYPKILRPLGWLMASLNTNYNITFRALFLKTINPVTIFERFLATQVVWQTIIFNGIEAYIGQRNFVYILGMATLWRVTGQYNIFLVLTSFIHYIRYISTYYSRENVDFGSFKRDVLLFKTLAVVQLFLHYIYPKAMSGLSIVPELDLLSILMISAGYFSSMLATAALGVDRTYFGAELGLCEPKWVNSFPYGYIPHPMITSQVFALMGFLKAAHFRAAAPVWLIPIHVGLYLIHLLQEIYDVHAPSKLDNELELLKSKLARLPEPARVACIAECEALPSKYLELKK